MTSVEIDKDLYRRLESIARNEKRSVDEVVQASLKQYVSAHSSGDEQAELDSAAQERNPLLMIAAAAEALGDQSSDGTVSARSREILENEFPEYLMNRLRNQDAEDDEEQRSSVSS